MSHPDTNYLLVLEKDHNAHSVNALSDLKQKVYEETKDEAYL